jgi:protein phosphatase
MREVAKEDTIEIVPEGCVAGGAPPLPYSSLVEVDMAGLSDQGKVRPNNADHFLTAQFGRYFRPVQTNLPEQDRPSSSEERGYGFAVADGVGIGPAAEVASKLAINTLVNLVLHTPDWILRQEYEYFAQQIQRRAADRYSQINLELSAEAHANPKLHGFATTLTVATSLGDKLHIAHVGDSRAYLFRQGELGQLTADHTVAQAMVNQGLVEQQEVARHRLRHVLTQALGMSRLELSPDVQQLTLMDQDCLMLCTDGLTDMVPKKLIAEILAEGKTAEVSCQHLVDEALAAGGNDNVTVVVARYKLPQRQRELDR